MMAFKFPVSAKKINFMKYVGEEVVALAYNCAKNNTQVSLSEYKLLRMNSYEQKFIEPYLSDEALLDKVKCATQYRARQLGVYDLPSHYDDYLLTDGVNELIKRLEARIKK